MAAAGATGYLWQVEKVMTLQIAMDARPRGPAAKRACPGVPWEPSPEGLGYPLRRERAPEARHETQAARTRVIRYRTGTLLSACGKLGTEGFRVCVRTLEEPREGYRFTGCGKTHVLYQGTTLVGP